jgi:putative DNA primase/helicase
VEGKRDWEGNLHRVLLNDKQLIVRMIQDHKAKLVMFDPLQSFLPPKTKMNDMETVRPVLDALIEAAQVTGCHILLVGHLSKARQETAGYKFLGSVDWFNASRSAMLVVKNPEHPETERFFYHVKHSLGPKAPGMGFSIAEENRPVFRWGTSTDVSIEDVLAGAPTRGNNKQAEARELILDELANGECTVENIKAAAKGMGISWRTMWEAKKKLKVYAYKGKGEFARHWYWSLPPAMFAIKDTSL